MGVAGYPTVRATSLGSMGVSVVVHGVVLAGLMFARVSTGPARARAIEFQVGICTVADGEVNSSGGLDDGVQSRMDPPAPALRDLRLAQSDSTAVVPKADAIESLAALATRTTAASHTSGGGDEPGTGRVATGPMVGTIAGGTAGGGATGNAAGGGRSNGSLWGIGGEARPRSIVYVLDRSGSMHDTLRLLQQELIRAVGSLDGGQWFNIVWFSGGSPEQLAPGLVQATLENKRRASDAVNRVVPAGRTEPVAALRAGLAMRPDVLVLLSDGDFGEFNDAVLSEIGGLAADDRPTINTILFHYDSRRGASDGSILRQIAALGGGTYKQVSEADFGPLGASISR